MQNHFLLGLVGYIYPALVLQAFCTMYPRVAPTLSSWHPSLRPGQGAESNTGGLSQQDGRGLSHAPPLPQGTKETHVVSYFNKLLFIRLLL